MPDEIDPLVKQLLDMVREESKQNSASTKNLINRFFILVAVLLVANGALSGVNLAMNFYGIEVRGEAPDRLNVAAAEDAPSLQPSSDAESSDNSTSHEEPP